MKNADLKLILQTLTIEQKLSLLTGANFWESVGLPQFNLAPIVLNDGPFGVRKPTINEGAGINEATYPATAFPTTSALASSFDPDLLFTMGAALGKECQDLGVDILLGPGINIKRSPLCGRNFEYFSEDPYLTAKMAGGLVRGLQSKGVGATLKHYAVNSQENDRFTMNALVDERALEEIYLKAFHDVIKDDKPMALMCSYNQVNGRHASRNPFLLTEKLRQNAGFSGLVMSDWGAVVNLKDSVNSGLNLEMPGGYQDTKALEIALKDGSLTAEKVDEMITPLLNLMIAKRDQPRKKESCNYVENFKVASQVSAACSVLLKNDENILPFHPKQKIALIGNFAKKPRYQGSGSSKINPYKLESLYETFVDEKVNFVYADGYLEHETARNDLLIAEAVECAKDVDVVLICAGVPESYEVEGYDRATLMMPESHNALIKALSEVHSRVVVLLSTGSPVLMPWLSEVKGVLLNHLAGAAGSRASYELLFGHQNPSGKLSETYPLSLEHSVPGPEFLEKEANVLYRESLYVGYRYYDTFKEKVLFPFGYGLSYTKFLTKPLDLVRKDDGYEVSVCVKNIGHTTGSEVVGIYIERSDSALFGPKKELKAFTKVTLAPGEKKTVNLLIRDEDLKVFHPLRRTWVLENTLYHVYVGINVLESELVFSFDLDNGEVLSDLKAYQELNKKYYDHKSFTVTSQDFRALYGEPLPLFFPNRKRPFTMENNIGDTTDYFIGRKIFNIMVKTAVKMAGDDPVMQEMAKESIKMLPFRTISALSSGAITPRQNEGLVDLLNGHLLRGAIKYLGKPKPKK